MGDASFCQTAFFSGEWSQTMGGRFDRPDYKLAMNVCVNGFPLEQGAWTRRPGTNLLGTTKNGNPGRLLDFDIVESYPYTMEFTDGFLRFWTGNVNGFALVPQELTTPYLSGTWSNIVSVQAEEQAVLLNGTQPQILTMDTPPGPGAYATFSLAPSNFLDGPYLDPFSGSQCTYSALSGNITLTFSFQPYGATVSYDEGDYVTSGGQGYQSVQSANEGNVVTNTAWWTPVNGGAPVGPNGFANADIGRHIRLFSTPPLYNSGSTYSKGATVTYNNAYYVSAINSNTGNEPDISPVDWALVTGAGYALWTWGRIIAISGSGLIGPTTTIGSMTGNGGLAAAFNSNPSQNLASSATAFNTITNPAVFVQGQGYAATNTAFYNGEVYTCGVTYGAWSASISYPLGAHVTYGGVIWASSGNGNLNNPPPGLPFSPPWVSLGADLPTNASFWSGPSAPIPLTVDCYVGQNYSATPRIIQQATIYPSNDQGFATIAFDTLGIALLASNTLPATPSSGTLLGKVVLTDNTFSSVTINSNNQTTAWNYVWFELYAVTADPGAGTVTQTIACAQAEFFAPNINNGSVITIQLVGPALLYPTGTVISTWAAGAFSNAVGWPTTGTYEGGRLWLAGCIPNRFDASNSNDIFNFAPTGPDGTVGDSNAISYTLNDKGVNPILWMEADAQGILCGTQEREWLIFATTLNSPLTPTTTDARPVTQIGCFNYPPARGEHTLVFIQKKQRKIVEYFADVFSGKFTAPNLIDKARHLTIGNVAEIKYQHEITPTIWCRNEDGSLIGATYRRDTLMTSQGPTFIGWHHHTLGSGRVPTSISVGASENGNLDALYMITHDGMGAYWVEVLSDVFEETNTINDASFLDAAVMPSSYNIVGNNLVLNGLSLLNGYTVQAWCGGLDAGQYVVTNNQTIPVQFTLADFTVSGGSISIPLDSNGGTSQSGLLTATYVNSFNGAMPIVVGFTYTSKGQLMRPLAPAESGGRIGPTLGKKRKIARTSFLLNNAQGMYWGTNFSKMRLMNFKTDGAVPYTLNTLFSGVFRDTIEDDWSYEGRVCWQITRPYPATVCAVEGDISTSE